MGICGGNARGDVRAPSGCADFGEEFREVVVNGFPFGVVAAEWVHVFGEVVSVFGQAAFDEWNDFVGCWVVGGDEDAALVAAGFEFGDLVPLVSRRVLCVRNHGIPFWALGDATSAMAD